MGIASVAKRREWTPEEAALVGKRPDAEIAKRLRRTRGDVAAKRQHLGVAYIAQAKRPWTAEEERLLGKDRDEETAKQIQRTLGAVRLRRIQLRIARFGEKEFRPRPVKSC